MIDSPKLLTDLQREVTRLHTDLRARCDAEPSADAPLKTAYDAARAGQRTALTYKAWREEELTNVAVAWVLACVFIRFLEDNALVETLHLAGPDAAGIGRARDQQIVFFREHPGLSEREYLEHVFTETAKLPGMADLFDRRHNPLWTVGPTGDGARALVEFWRKADAESGAPVHNFAAKDEGGRMKDESSAPSDLHPSSFIPHPFPDPTRFLGDLYQDLSEAARKRYALLQTPVFIEQFILDRTLTPAIETFGFREVRMIDPTCGSGHFLLGGFARLFALWNEALPGEVPSVIAQHALDQVFGVDLNPNVVAIARFRLLLAALRVSGVTRLRDAYDFKIHVAAGDSLLHGRRFRASESFTTGAQRTFDTEELFRDELKHHYEVEDVEALHRILGQQYHAVVGNPPYITVKDRAVSELYRARFPSCSGKYSLSVPFMERFFDLAVKGDGTPQQPAGFVGQITANSFMKREFGSKLVEEYLPRWDLTHIVDSSGAYIPGHTTSTVILFGKNQPPVSGTIRTVLGIRGEPATPDDPAQGFVWQAIIKQVDHPGTESEWVSSSDSLREKFAKHPWSIGGGGIGEMKEDIEAACSIRLLQLTRELGITAVTGEDDLFVFPHREDLLRLRVERTRTLVTGDLVREWQVTDPPEAVWLYDDQLELMPLAGLPNTARLFWTFRSSISRRKRFGTPMVERGLTWYEWQELYKEKLRTPLTITWGEIATHNHFVLERGGKVFKQTAPVIKLKDDATVTDYQSVLGLLNSSTGCFWLQQVCPCKGLGGQGGGIKPEHWHRAYAFNASNIGEFPIPRRPPVVFATALDELAKRLQQSTPALTLADPEKRNHAALQDARAKWNAILQRMIALQEELDWHSYRAYGLIEDDGLLAPVGLNGLPCVDGPETTVPPLRFAERAFELFLALRMARGEVHTKWFDLHGSTPITEVPHHWPAPYRELVERRLRRIADDPAIRLIEQPEYKRRWNTEPWDDAFARAAREWLLLRLETYFFGSERMTAKAKAKDEGGRMKDEVHGGFAEPEDGTQSSNAAGPSSSSFILHHSSFATRPAFTTTNQLAEIAKTDRAFQAVAEQLMGGPGFSVPKLVRELVELASVPALPAQRYKPSGLLKRHDWEHVWELQRREDAIDAAEKVDEPGLPDPERTRRKLAAAARKRAELGDIPVPPKYASSDFKKSVWWSLRGKLDVPKERWTTYPGTERTEDPSPVIAWAGWDHAQQARAVAEYYVDAKQTYGFPPEKLTLLLAALLELQPWLTQWHAELDPAFGVSPAEAIRGFLDSECHALGVTREDLERVRVG